MNRLTKPNIPVTEQSSWGSYPAGGMALEVVFLMASPFISRWLVFPVFVLCLYRLIRYDVQVFSTDFCILTPLSPLFAAPSGMSLLTWLCLGAAVWYLIQEGIRGELCYVVLLFLLNYLVWRMNWNINGFVLCFGQLFLLCVLLPRQDTASALRGTLAFCYSLILISVYALAFRDTQALHSIRGTEVPAFFGSGMRRFQCVFKDPNYYMSMLVAGISLQLKLYHCGYIRGLVFWTVSLAMVLFGVLTYSKTFFLALVLLVAIFVAWQFWNRKLLRGILYVALIIGCGSYLIFSPSSPFAVVMSRLAGATNLSELTTGRTDVFAAYRDIITQDAKTFLLGCGLAASSLAKDPHNLFLEITYYTGVIGLALFLLMGFALAKSARRQAKPDKENPIARYEVLIMAVLLFNTLHGIFSLTVYAIFYLAFLSLMLGPSAQEVDV